MLQNNKDDILDYESFKQVLKKSWAGDNALNQLINGKFAKESDFKALFETDLVQSWLQQNIENVAIPVIMRLKNIEEGRARQVWNRLPARKRGALLTKINKGQRIKVRRKTVKPDITPKGKVKLIKQTRGGKTYKRAKPVKWSEMQEKFVENNASRGLKWVTQYYNRIFPDYRTQGSITNKYYRLRKSKTKENTVTNH
jgi:hypothetical protein